MSVLKHEEALDPELLHQVERSGRDSLSPEASHAIREALERRRRRRLLGELLRELDTKYGPVSADLLATYEALLS